jgi:glycerol-3-phosphate responsive antiterminator
MKKMYKEVFEDSPIIAAVNSDECLERCLACDSQIVFILYGDVITIPAIVEKVKASGKLAFVYIDLIQGLSSKEVAVDFIANFTQADGIISTKIALLQRAKELSLCTVMRCFVIDSKAYTSIEKQLRNVHPDILEILPGPMPSVVKRIKTMFHYPIIASGLISEKDEVYALLDAGASSISTTDQAVWSL